MLESFFLITTYFPQRVHPPSAPSTLPLCPLIFIGVLFAGCNGGRNCYLLVPIPGGIFRSFGKTDKLIKNCKLKTKFVELTNFL